jgi:hypothetical protein
MPENIRYAVARDPRINNTDNTAAPKYDKGQRTWWELRREDWGSWDLRRLFEKKSSALALIWKYRDLDANRYRYTLIKVTRKAAIEEIIP